MLKPVSGSDAGIPLCNLVGRDSGKLVPLKTSEASKAVFESFRRRDMSATKICPLENERRTLVAVGIVSNVYLVDHHRVIQCNIRDITNGTYRRSPAKSPRRAGTTSRGADRRTSDRTFRRFKTLEGASSSAKIFISVKEIIMKHQFGNISRRSDGLNMFFIARAGRSYATRQFSSW